MVEARGGEGVKLKVLEPLFSVCRVDSAAEVDLSAEFCFVGKTDEELSLVCPQNRVPEHALAREDGWRAFRVEGVLDFSLTGILARLSSALAEAGIGLFAVSTYNTDYILVKREDLPRALEALRGAGCEVV